MDIVRYVAREDERAARLVGQRIIEAGDKLGIAATGHSSRVAGYYEKLVPKTSYILVYTLPARSGREYVLVVDIIHMARNWPKGGWPDD
jgi:toxin ParE1/3/4